MSMTHWWESSDVLKFKMNTSSEIWNLCDKPFSIKKVSIKVPQKSSTQKRFNMDIHNIKSVSHRSLYTDDNESTVNPATLHYSEWFAKVHKPPFKIINELRKEKEYFT